LRITDIAVNSDETVEPTSHAEDDYRYIELADINQVIGTIESANEIKGKEAPSRARMLLRAGDVVASTVEGSLDKVALVSEEYHGAIGSTGFFVLRPRTVQSGYLLALVKSIIVREQMRCEASGTILAAVPAKSLRNIIVPNIPPEKRDEIAQLVEKSHSARREAKALLEKAKRAVEIAIEESEERAMEFLG
jgi:restriction endonuclease S subunit